MGGFNVRRESLWCLLPLVCGQSKRHHRSHYVSHLFSKTKATENEGSLSLPLTPKVMAVEWPLYNRTRLVWTWTYRTCTVLSKSCFCKIAFGWSLYEPSNRVLGYSSVSIDPSPLSRMNCVWHLTFRYWGDQQSGALSREDTDTSDITSAAGQSLEEQERLGLPVRIPQNLRTFTLPSGFPGA